MKSELLGLFLIAGVSPWTACGSAEEIPTCVVDSDEAVRPLQDEVCSNLEISNLSVENLDGFLPYTTAGAVLMYDNKNLNDISRFISKQKDLFSLNVSDSPLREELQIDSNRLDSLSLESTRVRHINVASSTFGSLSLWNNPVESVTLLSLLDLVIDGSDATTLDAFQGVTTLNRLIVRNTSIDFSLIESFAGTQNDDLILIHCGNVNDAPCESFEVL